MSVVCHLWSAASLRPNNSPWQRLPLQYSINVPECGFRLAWEALTIMWRPELSVTGMHTHACRRSIAAVLDCTAELIGPRHSPLRKGFGVVDGSHLPVETFFDIETQNIITDGTCALHVKSVCILSSGLGIILYAAINARGSFHDAAVARELYRKLLYQTEHAYWLIADSAFPATNGLQTKVRIR
ncbi:hypothetical protein V1504DRAFT_494425 [Lipomyces starkeyi]